MARGDAVVDDLNRFLRRKPRPRPNVLNPTLYGLLVERFGRVEVASRREAAVPGKPRVNFRTRCVEAEFAHMGEYYKVCCPFCNDRRFRLYVNHRWCTPSPVDGEPMTHLATCYNEGCLAERYKDFHDRVWGFMNASARRRMKAMRIEPGIVVDRPFGPVPLPGECIPVDRLPRDHPAAVYLEDRGFDLGELAASWEVSFCRRAEGMYATAGQRIIVPIRFRGERVGWQARYVGELDWKRMSVPKYYTQSNFRTGKALYNYDQARLHDVVVVCEGVADVWAVGEPGVALFGKKVGSAQEDLLARWSKPHRLVVLLLDPGAWDDEGRHQAFLEGFRRRLRERVVEVALPDSRDPGQYTRKALWRVINAAVRKAGFDPSSYR